MKEIQSFQRFLREVACFLEEEVKMETSIESLICMVGWSAYWQPVACSFVGKAGGQLFTLLPRLSFDCDTCGSGHRPSKQ